MEVLAAPLEQSDIDELVSYFPDFRGQVPEEARYWKKSDLELYLGSNGQLRPKESPGTCAFLSRARQRLAELKVGDASAEYLSWCRHLKAQELPSCGAPCRPVATAKEVPAVPRSPVVVPCPKGWCGLAWEMDFWRTRSREMWWTCRQRSPAFEHDKSSVDVQGEPREFMDYAKHLEEKDPKCLEENALAYPRLAMDGWCPFISLEGRQLLEKHWRELTPPGVKDLSPKWIRMFASIFNLDFMDFFARFYKLSLGGPGCISRLHVTNNGAHSWYTQIQGRRLFFLFSPQDGRYLAEEEGGPVDHLEGYAAAASAVDIFFPSQKRHGSFKDTSPQVVILRPGESLVVPCGWWHYAVHLEVSVTLHRAFWGLQNRERLSDELREAFIASKMPEELRERAARNIAELHERIMEDDGDSEEET